MIKGRIKAKKFFLKNAQTEYMETTYMHYMIRRVGYERFKFKRFNFKYRYFIVSQVCYQCYMLKKQKGLKVI